MKILRVALFIIFCHFMVYSQECKVELAITTDFSKEQLDPQIANLDGKDIRKHLFQPGKYALEIQHPGYYALSKKIAIPQGETFYINEKLVSKPRGITFGSATGSCLKIQDIVNMQNDCSVKTYGFGSYDTFKPGTKIKLKLLFKHHQTMIKTYTIEPGEGPYIAYLSLNKLQTYEIRCSSKQIKLNDIAYSYDLYVNSQPVEKHLVDFKKEKFVTIQVPPKSVYLRVYRGYFYKDIRFSEYMSFGRLRNIDIDRLITHLDRVASINGMIASLNAIESLLNSANRLRLRSESTEKLDYLIATVESWKSQLDSNEYARLQKSLEDLRNLKQSK